MVCLPGLTVVIHSVIPETKAVWGKYPPPEIGVKGWGVHGVTGPKNNEVPKEYLNIQVELAAGKMSPDQLLRAWKY